MAEVGVEEMAPVELRRETSPLHQPSPPSPSPLQQQPSLLQQQPSPPQQQPSPPPPLPPPRAPRMNRTSWLQPRADSSSVPPAGSVPSDGDSSSGDEDGSEKEGLAVLPVGWQEQDAMALRPVAEALLHRHVLVWWGNLGDPRWFHGEVTEWDLHRQNGSGMHEVSYRDGDKKWHYLDGPSSGTKKVKWALQSGSASA